MWQRLAWNAEHHRTLFTRRENPVLTIDSAGNEKGQGNDKKAKTVIFKTSELQRQVFYKEVFRYYF